MISLRTLKTFLAVVHHGTFAAAGKEIGLTPAAVGLQIRALEEALDQSLFDLYEAGLITYEDALRNADSLNDLRLAIKLQGKEAKNRNMFSGIGNLDIVPETNNN